MHFKNAGTLRLGSYMNFKQNLKAKQSTVNETFTYDYNGGEVMIDSIAMVTDTKGVYITQRIPLATHHSAMRAPAADPDPGHGRDGDDMI